ncbi:MAG TPA: CPXCG motif-containing cysteine-rich protein [Armatimonadota bacterium]
MNNGTAELENVVIHDEDEADSAEMGGVETYTCAFCGEPNELFVDRTASKHQQFTEDCDVCCRPNLITVQIDPDEVLWIDAEQEDEA